MFSLIKPKTTSIVSGEPVYSSERTVLYNKMLISILSSRSDSEWIVLMLCNLSTFVKYCLPFYPKQQQLWEFFFKILIPLTFVSPATCASHCKRRQGSNMTSVLRLCSHQFLVDCSWPFLLDCVLEKLIQGCFVWGLLELQVEQLLHYIFLLFYWKSEIRLLLIFLFY